MQIDELAGNTVKITLNPSDMDGYRIKCEDISGDSRTSELALSRLISCLSEDHNLGLCGERLLVEAFPKSDGGCTLYISCLKGTPSGKNASCRPPLTAVICEGELCVLARLCKALKTVADRVYLYADREHSIYGQSASPVEIPAKDIQKHQEIRSSFSVQCGSAWSIVPEHDIPR